MKHTPTIVQTLRAETTENACRLLDFLGCGVQGEVYRAQCEGSLVALKWFLPAYAQLDNGLRSRLQTLVKMGSPSERFLWPTDLVSSKGEPGFGYLMPLLDRRFVPLDAWLARDVHPSFHALATVGLELAHHFLLLHSQGLCYHDINSKNIFFDPATGEIRIGDNDNVDLDGRPGAIQGTPDFMAPEVIRGEAPPTTQTDLHSLATLLFLELFTHHPLQGRKVLGIHCFDLPARQRLFGREPVFVFDRADLSNEALPLAVDPSGEAGANALCYWPLYPQFLREMFTQAFTLGLHEPAKRIRETQWRAALVRLRDSIYLCPRCHAENFYDLDALRQGNHKPSFCWKCGNALALPTRLRIGRETIVVANPNAKLFPHHVDDQKRFDFSCVVAAVCPHRHQPGIWGLQNVSPQSWSCAFADGSSKEIVPGQTVRLADSLRINFGKASAMVRAGGNP